MVDGILEILSKKHIEIEKRSTPEEMIEGIIAYYEDIIDAMPGNIYWFDKNLIAVGCNRNVLKMFGLKSPEQFKGLTYDEQAKICNWTDHAKQSFVNDTKEVLQTGKPKLNIEEPPIPDQNGKMRYFLTSRVPLFDSKMNVIGIIGVSIDITERRELEEALKFAKEKEKLNFLKTEFIRNMEHDIRTPVGGISEVARLLSIDEKNTEKREMLETIAKAAEELLNYANSILAFSKIESHFIPVIEKKFILKELVESVVNMEMPAALHKKLKLSVNFSEDLQQIVVGDKYRLKCILINLISNSIKFTSQGFIKISVDIGKQASRKIILRLKVEDSGIGIPKEKQNYIYEKFVRGTPANEGIYKGFGLGLHIVKQFVHEMDGEIYLESEEGKGTVFVCDFPFKIPLIENDHFGLTGS